MRKLLAVLLCSAALASAQGPRRAPGFALPDTKMHFHDLADYRGKVLVLEFMQTTCPHCARFADILAQVGGKYGDKVAVLAVTNVNTDRPAQVEQYVSGHKITYPVVMDQGQMMFSYIQSPQGCGCAARLRDRLEWLHSCRLRLRHYHARYFRRQRSFRGNR